LPHVAGLRDCVSAIARNRLVRRATDFRGYEAVALVSVNLFQIDPFVLCMDRVEQYEFQRRQRKKNET